MYRDQAKLDQELRKEIKQAWPKLNEKKLDLLLPQDNGQYPVRLFSTFRAQSAVSIVKKS